MKDKFVTLSSLKKFKEKQDDLVNALLAALKSTLEDGQADLLEFLESLQEQLKGLDSDIEDIEDDIVENYVPKDVDDDWWKNHFHIEDYVKFTTLKDADDIIALKDKTDFFSHTKIEGKDYIVIDDGAYLKGPIFGYTTLTDFNTSIGQLTSSISDKLSASDIKFTNGNIQIKEVNLLDSNLLLEDNLVTKITSNSESIKENLGINTLGSEIQQARNITQLFTLDGNDLLLASGKKLFGYFTAADGDDLNASLTREIEKKVSTDVIISDGKFKDSFIPSISVSKLTDLDSTLESKGYALSSDISTLEGKLPTLSNDGKTITFTSGQTFTHQSLNDYLKTADLEDTVASKGFTKLTATDIDNKISAFNSSNDLKNTIITKLKDDQILSNDGKVNFNKIKDVPDFLESSDIASWAKASEKPTYTAEEVGALSTDWTPSASDIPELSISKITDLQDTLDTIPTLSSDKKTITFAGNKKLTISGLASETFVTSQGYQTSAEVESAITGKGYQTADQVESAITGKGYQTASQVESAITGKGYQTSTNVIQTLKNKQILDSNGNLSISHDKITGLGSLAVADSIDVSKITDLNTTLSGYQTKITTSNPLSYNCISGAPVSSDDMDEIRVLKATVNYLVNNMATTSTNANTSIQNLNLNLNNSSYTHVKNFEYVRRFNNTTQLYEVDLVRKV